MPAGIQKSSHFGARAASLCRRGARLIYGKRIMRTAASRSGVVSCPIEKKMPRPRLPTAVTILPLAPRHLPEQVRGQINVALINEFKKLKEMGMMPELMDIALRAQRDIMVTLLEPTAATSVPKSSPHRVEQISCQRPQSLP